MKNMSTTPPVTVEEPWGAIRSRNGGGTPAPRGGGRAPLTARNDPAPKVWGGYSTL